MTTSSATESVTSDARFWSHVAKTEGCWEYVGYRDRQGYGKIGRKGLGNTLAHRYAWIITFGPIPDGLNVLHHCDNPPCVRPDHLFLGTQLANMRDRDRKCHHRPGRFPGETHPSHRLTDEQVLDARRRYQEGETIRALAIEYGVVEGWMGKIVRGQAWKHLAAA